MERVREAKSLLDAAVQVSGHQRRREVGEGSLKDTRAHHWVVGRTEGWLQP